MFNRASEQDKPTESIKAYTTPQPPFDYVGSLSLTQNRSQYSKSVGKIFYYIVAILIVGGLGFFLFANNTSPEPVQPIRNQATEAVREDVARREDVNKEEVSIVAVVTKEWRDSCLGIDKPDLICAQVITPGYEITATAKSKTYTYHTNASGSAIVLIRSFENGI